MRKIFIILILFGIRISAEELISLNFKDIDVRDLVRLISDWTGKNFLLDQRVRGTITIISPKKVTKEEALRIFESILFANDLAMVEVGKVVKIIPAAETRQSPIPTIKEKKLLPSESYITKIIPLKYIDGNQVANVIRNFITRNGFLQVYDPTNTLIIIETIANLERLEKIIEELDQPIYEQKVEVIKLEWASAQDVANSISQIIQAGRRPGQIQQQQIRIIPDTRTNSIIVSASKQDIEYIKEIVKKVDVEAEGGEVNVIYLKYANAEEVLKVIQGLAPPQQQQIIRISADKSTNSLIVAASPKDFQRIKEIVEKIDIQRKQIFVSAIIMEISSQRFNQYGLSTLFITKAGEGGVVAGESVGAPLPTAILSPENIANLSGLLLGFIGKTVKANIGGQEVEIPAISAIINAIAGDSGVDILSTPQILTLNNKEAEIRVATNIPFPTGQIITSAGIGGAAVPTITIQRQDVGIILKIKPQIIELEKKVQLDVEVEISDIAEAPPGLATQQLGIATLRRTAKTTILVGDGETAAIGGLMRTRTALSRSKVPLLGDVPVIGFLFRSAQKRYEKSNLIIFLTPKIVETKEDMEKIKEEKIKEDIEIREKEGL